MLALKEKKARKLNLLAFEGTPKFGKKKYKPKTIKEKCPVPIQVLFSG